ncbi:restriction endonuclease subunit S [Micromonospora luteifusca]|uniref:restriction endonuclease subunit S n=1 Tax=Micromonospora luteifusca TaxID=709860 RepID=UPI0033A56247
MSEWSRATLGDLARFQRGHDLPTTERRPGAVPVVGSAGVSGSHDAPRANAPGVVIGRSGASIGHATYVTSDFWPLNTSLYVTDFRGNDPRFVYYHLQTINFNSFNSGSAQPSLNRNYFKHVPILLPSIHEQKFISSLLGVLDDKIAVNDRVAATLDELSHALFSKHFSQAPKGPDWQIGKLSDLCGTQYGYTASSTDAPVGPRFLRVKDINKNNWIGWPDVPYCRIPADTLDRYRLRRGDIVVARMADPGKSAIVEDEEEAVFASYLVRLKTASLAHAYFVWGFLKSERYQDYVAASKSGSVQSNMNAKVIVGAPIDIPPLELMQKHFGTVVPLRQKLLAVLRESSALVALRDQLLPELMSGRLRVRDAEKVVEEAV